MTLTLRARSRFSAAPERFVERPSQTILCAVARSGTTSSLTEPASSRSRGGPRSPLACVRCASKPRSRFGPSAPCVATWPSAWIARTESRAGKPTCKSYLYFLLVLRACTSYLHTTPDVPFAAHSPGSCKYSPSSASAGHYCHAGWRSVRGRGEGGLTRLASCRSDVQC